MYLCLKIVHELFKVLHSQEPVSVFSEEVDEQGCVNFVVVDPVQTMLTIVKLETSEKSLSTFLKEIYNRKILHYRAGRAQLNKPHDGCQNQSAKFLADQDVSNVTPQPMCEFQIRLPFT